jgi:hypothetical protein
MAATTISKGPIQRRALWILKERSSQWVVHLTALRGERGSRSDRDSESKNKGGKKAVVWLIDFWGTRTIYYNYTFSIIFGAFKVLTRPRCADNSRCRLLI